MAATKPHNENFIGGTTKIIMVHVQYTFEHFAFAHLTKQCDKIHKFSPWSIKNRRNCRRFLILHLVLVDQTKNIYGILNLEHKCKLTSKKRSIPDLFLGPLYVLSLDLDQFLVSHL